MKFKRHSFLFFLLMTFCLPLKTFTATPSTISDVECNPTTPLANQNRTVMKHRPPNNSLPSNSTSVADMIGWANPSQYPNGKIPFQAGVIDDRENKVYTLQGDIWLATIEDNDCDIH